MRCPTLCSPRCDPTTDKPHRQKTVARAGHGIVEASAVVRQHVFESVPSRDRLDGTHEAWQWADVSSSARI